ncbi:MAG: hypoxanthine phosphoribosyltransferase [Actinomycetales bacterium]|nr:hypoxanthine phosphoribosyltransferase [Actinomycetales bacterium]
MRLDPDVAAQRAAVRAALADLAPGAAVLVACSGGADSLALAAATAFVAPRAGLRAGAVVVDHGLQPGSAAVAERAAAQCRGLGLDPVEVVRVDVAPDGGPEAGARTARYAALAEAAERHGAAAVLLGHTLDDQAETVLLGLARGSGARSLAGMPARRGVLRRPFLGVRRAATAHACAVLGLEPWHDPTNGPADDPGALPLRSRVRHEALPALEAVLGPGVAEALARTADQLREDADALAAAAADLLAAALAAGKGPPSGVGREPGEGASAAVLARAPDAVRRRALRDLLVRWGAPAGSLARVHVLAVDALVTDWRGQGPVSLPGGIRVARRYGRLTLAPDGEEEQRVDVDDMGQDLERVLLTREQIDARLAEMAAQIDADYVGRDLLLVGVLKGAVMVMADLSRHLHSPVEMDWMAVSSYGAGTSSSGVVRILKDLDTDLTGRHVLIVEDIIDSGLTLSWLLSNLRTRGAASVEIAALLRKPEAAKVEVNVRYVGFDIPSEFVVGYGLDYAEKYRNLPFVGTLAQHVYAD